MFNTQNEICTDTYAPVRNKRMEPNVFFLVYWNSKDVASGFLQSKFFDESNFRNFLMSQGHTSEQADLLIANCHED